MVIRSKSATTFFHCFDRTCIALHYNYTKIKCSQMNIFSHLKTLIIFNVASLLT